MRRLARSVSAPIARAAAASLPAPRQLPRKAQQPASYSQPGAGPGASRGARLLLGSCTCAFSLLFDNNHIRDERPLSTW